MMRLLSAPPSPFGRKVKLVMYIKGLAERVTVELADPREPNAALAAANPLGKIPALVLEDGTALFDSLVICEYLDSLAPAPVMFPPAGLERYRMLTRAALADGIMEAALLIVYEDRYRPADKRVPEWIARQQSKIEGGLAAFEAAPPQVSGAPDYAAATLAAALGYLDFRLYGQWRARHPTLEAWLEGFAAAVPAFARTAPA